MPSHPVLVLAGTWLAALVGPGPLPVMRNSKRKKNLLGHPSQLVMTSFVNHVMPSSRRISRKPIFMPALKRD